jgi:hypothetical protein
MLFKPIRLRSPRPSTGPLAEVSPEREEYTAAPAKYQKETRLSPEREFDHL